MNTMADMPRESRWRFLFLVAVLAAFAALVAVPQAHASSQYLTTWGNLYPNSTSDNNAGCQLCHGSSTQNINPYGFALAQCNGATGTITQRIQAVEGVNSDGDAGGFTNLQETNANTQPGWTTPNVPVWGRTSCVSAGTNTYPGAGNVDPPPAAPNIAVNPTTLAFGVVNVGNSATLTTTIQNTGTADLNVTAINLAGTTEFSLVNPPTTPFTLAPNASQTVNVAYTPNAAGADAGTLDITSNDPDSPTVTVNLSGTGNVVTPNACNFSVQPTSLDFGTVNIGDPTPTLSTTVTNNGTAACTITASVTGSGEFTLATNSPVQVAPNASVPVSVAYAPVDEGADTGNLNLTSNDANNPQSVDVPLAGTGVQPPVDACNFSVAPTSLAFGDVTTGTTATLSTTVTNSGTAACNIAATVSGSADFALASASPITVAANGGTASVSVSYSPATVGTDAGNLNLTSDDVTNPQSVDVALSGAGVETPACTGITITNAEWRIQGNGSLRVSATGVRDGPINLFNAFDPNQTILATANGRSGRANFNVNGRNLNPVPCVVRVEQADVGLCGEAPVENAPADCGPQPPVGEAPVARGDMYATPNGTSTDPISLSITASRLSGVLYNDFDPDGGSLTAVNLDTTGTVGTVTLNTDGSFTYTRPAVAINPVQGDNNNITDTFTYQAQDAQGNLSDVTTVVIQIMPKQVDYKITMNYELGMHCTGFEFAYCCVLPPYNSILAQVIKPAQGDPACAQQEPGCNNFIDGYPRLLEGDPNTGLDGLNRETVVRDWDSATNQFTKYQLRYFHDVQPRQEGNTSKPNTTTLASAAEGNSLQYFNTVFDSAAPDATTNALVYGPYNGYQNVIQGNGNTTDPTDNYANAWLNHFYIYGNLEGQGNTGLEADKVRLGVTGQVQYPADSGAALQPLGPTGTVPAGFENVLTFSADTGTVVFTQAKVLEDLPIMLTSPRIWEALGLPLTPFEDTINFFGDPGAVDEDTIRPYVAMKAQLHDYPSGNATIRNGQPVIGFGTAPIDIPNCERCHSAPSLNPETGLPNMNSPNWVRTDVTFPHANGGAAVGLGLEAVTNMEINFWLAYYDILPGVDSTWYARLKGAAINMLTLHDSDQGTSFTANYAGVECTNQPDPITPPANPTPDPCSYTNGLADLTDNTAIPQNTRLGNESVICQRCHADNVIANVKSGTFDAAGNFPIPPITEAIHDQHRNQDEGGVIVFNDSLGRDGGCQGCHPAHRSDGVMDNYPITLGGDNVNADGDNRLNPGGCFVGRDVHSNPLKDDPGGAETDSHLNTVGDWLLTNVANDQGDWRGIWCTNCHSQLGQELWRTEDCNNLITADCVFNPRAAGPALSDVVAAINTGRAALTPPLPPLTEQEAINFLDPKVLEVNGVPTGRTSDQTHAVWNPAITDAGVATIEVDGSGNPVVTFDPDGDPSVNILSFCTTPDCVDLINGLNGGNKNDPSTWRYPANAYIDPVNNSGFPVPFAAATDGRDHWLSAGEPHCADCHDAPYVEQSGNISAYPPFNYPAKASLMRYTRGHQDVSCQACHESIHGLYPVTPTIDTTSYAQAAALNNDGSHGPVKCAACHTHVDADQIPTWVDNLTYNDPTTPGQDNIPVAGNFDAAVGWMHTYTAEANPAQDVCQNCHGPEVPEIGDAEYLEHAMVNRVSRVAMDNAERVVNNGEVFGEIAGAQREQLCSNCHTNGTRRTPNNCNQIWRRHLIEGRVSEIPWEDESVLAGLGTCGW